MKESEISAIMAQIGLLVARADKKGKALDVSLMYCLGPVLSLSLYPSQVDYLERGEPEFKIILELNADGFYEKASNVVEELRTRIA